MMEVDPIAAKVATESTQVAPNSTKAAIKTMHPSTLSTIVKIEEGTKHLQPRDGNGVAPMLKQIFLVEVQDSTA